MPLGILPVIFTPRDFPYAGLIFTLDLCYLFGTIALMSQVWRIDAFAKQHLDRAERLLASAGGNPLAIGTLIEDLPMNKTQTLTLPAPDFEARNRRILLQSLSALQPEEAANLTLTHWQKLYRVLQGDDAYLIVATLKALKAAGNADALIPVRAIAEGKSPAGQNEAIRALAIECLPALEKRAAQAKNISTLLRAANAPAIPDNTLLRPVSAASETPPEQLLRASSVAGE